MNFLLWITVGFIVLGLFVLMSMKKSMEERVALAIENKDGMEGEQISTKPVVWWIVGATVWGLVSMLLIVWFFSVYV
ncbi:hypothetical protein [Oceanobacillus indicireducens]|uniref:Uncharacterized protein n=1 Tax=Oceanobacillus indicireducens TaxID=1004261 RepID=A0A917XZS8_9BACI|nr:hypothetical protein [Oceanobacillus indicireducens]GGN58588.1 hypothetical protein GCM10007971_20810 [Oceanobacillus indicireducens]